MKRPKPPGPSEILEELGSEALAFMDLGDVAGFSDSLNAMIDIHASLLRAYTTVDKGGQKDSYAFKTEGLFFNTFIRIRWSQKYLRIFQRAGDLLGHRPEFFKKSTEVPYSLVDQTSGAVPSKVLEHLLELTLYLSHRSGDWWLRRAVEEFGKRPSIYEPARLSGYEAGIYEKVMRDFASIWEDFQYFPKAIWKWDAESFPPNERWDRLRMSSGFIRENLLCTAYMVAASVWRGDEFSASIMSDSLIIWIKFFERELLNYGYAEENSSFLDGDFCEYTWDDVLKNFETTDPESGRGPKPEVIFWNIIENLWVDVILTLSAIIMAWGSEWSDRDSLSSKVSRKLLYFEVEDQSMPGAYFRKLSTRKVLMALIRQYTAKENGYRKWINDLVYKVDRLSEDGMVRGRPYPVFTKSELSQLALFQTAILISLTSYYRPTEFSIDLEKEIALIPRISSANGFGNFLENGIGGLLKFFEEDEVVLEYWKVLDDVVDSDEEIGYFDSRKSIAKDLLENFLKIRR